MRASRRHSARPPGLPHEEAAGHGSTMNNEWPLWEVFIRSQHGLAHKHVGSLHAPDAEMAVSNARDVYTRRNEGVSIWVVRAGDIVASSPPTRAPVRPGQRQGLPPPDLLPDARRSEEPVRRRAHGRPSRIPAAPGRQRCLILSQQLRGVVRPWPGAGRRPGADQRGAGPAGPDPAVARLCGRGRGQRPRRRRAGLPARRPDFRNCLLVEQPNGHYGNTRDAPVPVRCLAPASAEGADGNQRPAHRRNRAEGVKEVRYHVERSAI
jgi:ring-1,2-phenylacetyl-CoA epoxidase subunit PaaB